MTQDEIDIGLLEKEIADWNGIADFYEQDEETGRALHAGKDRRCGICSRYRKFSYEDGEERLNCTECPVVRATGHACSTLWKEAGLSKSKAHESAESAIETCRTTAAKIREIVGVLRYGRRD